MSNNSNMQEIAEIRELTAAELDFVSGGGFWSDLWDAVSDFINVLSHPGVPWT